MSGPPSRGQAVASARDCRDPWGVLAWPPGPPIFPVGSSAQSWEANRPGSRGAETLLLLQLLSSSGALLAWPGGSCPPRRPWSPRASSAYTAPSKVLRQSCFSLTQAWTCVPCSLRHYVPAWRLRGSSQPSAMAEAEGGPCVKHLAGSSGQAVWAGGALRPADGARGVGQPPARSSREGIPRGICISL